MKILLKEILNYKLSLFFLLVATYISTTFELTLPLLLANALNVGISQNYGLSYIKNIAIMMTILVIITVILTIIISFIITKLSAYVSTNIRNQIFSKALSLKNDEFKNFSTTTLIIRTNQDTEQIKVFTSSFLSIIFKSPIILASCVTVLKTLNKNFYLVLFIAISILIIFLIISIVKIFPLSKKIQNTTDDLSKHLKEKISGYKIIKSYNNMDLENNNFEKTNKQQLNLYKRIIKISSSINPFLNLIVNSVTIIILLMCINLIKENSIEAGTIIAAIQYILQMLLSVLMLSMLIISFPTLKISLNRISQILKASSYEEKSEIKEEEINNITFENISFSYNENTLLDKISFSINKGEKIGIIGPNGSGKSTLFKLLLKECQLKDGKITINNININELSRKDITNNLTYSPQKPYILKGTILENIAFTNNTLTMQDIAKIIHTCNLEKFISEKKENLNYLLEENGANLSFGQKQRINLARTLARKSNTIILDEPFSALDYNTENEIITKLNQFYKEKTFIILSQRISSIKNCEKILVIDKGKLIDAGTHEELINRCQLYKNIYKIEKEVIEYDI